MLSGQVKWTKGQKDNRIKGQKDKRTTYFSKFVLSVMLHLKDVYILVGLQSVYGSVFLEMRKFEGDKV